MSAFTIIQYAEDLAAIPSSGPEAAAELARRLRAVGRYREVVAGHDEVVVVFDPAMVNNIEASLRRDMARPEQNADTAVAGQCHTIALYVGGHAAPDLDALCAALGVARAAFLAKIATGTFPVEMIGFTPGFAYLGGAPYDVPRREVPRTSVPAGSVGIAGGRLGLYALRGPGGWPLIGRTDASLFDPERDPVLLLQVGDRVQFRLAEGEGL